MALDQSKVGQHIAEQMEAIEADYADKEGDYEIGDICTIVEVRGGGESQVRMRPSITTVHGLLGMIKMAELQAIEMIKGGSGGA